MTYDEAIESLLNTCDDLEETIEQLQEENAFLADTIVKHNLDEIVSERRALLDDIKQRELAAELKTKNAEAIKAEYLNKLNELNERLSDVKAK
jgi:prefoldin subunit 5